MYLILALPPRRKTDVPTTATVDRNIRSGPRLYIFSSLNGAVGTLETHDVRLGSIAISCAFVVI